MKTPKNSLFTILLATIVYSSLPFSLASARLLACLDAQPSMIVTDNPIYKKNISYDMLVEECDYLDSKSSEIFTLNPLYNLSLTEEEYAYRDLNAVGFIGKIKNVLARAFNKDDKNLTMLFDTQDESFYTASTDSLQTLTSEYSRESQKNPWAW